MLKLQERVSSFTAPPRLEQIWVRRSFAEDSTSKSPLSSRTDPLSQHFGKSFSHTINGHRAAAVPTEPVHANASAHGADHRITLFLFDEMRLLRECMAHLLRDNCPDIDVLCYDRWAKNFDYAGPGPTLILFNLRQSSVERFFIDHIAQDLAEYFNNTPILALSDHENSEEAILALKSGLAGVFPATSSSSLLIAVIRLIIAGGRFVPPDVLPLTNSRWETMKEFRLQS